MSASDRAFVNYPSSPSSSRLTEVKSAVQTARQEQEVHIDDVDATMPQQDVLIPPWSANHRSSRPPALPSALNPVERGSPNLAIQPIRNNFTHNNGQDVHSNPLNGSRNLLPTSSLYRDVHYRQPSGSNLPSSSIHSQNASINNLNRPRTSLPVFATTSDLAAHYGLPRKLPLPPRINSTNNTRPPVPHFNESVSSPQQCSVDPTAALQHLMSGYLGMLRTNPDENTAVATSQSPAIVMNESSPDMGHSAEEAQVQEAAQNIAQLLLNTPDMWNEYLTSPFDESPLDLPLETPAQGSAELNDFFTSPAVADLNNLDSFGCDFPLFPQGTYTEESVENKMSVQTMPSQAAPAPPNFDGLLTMSPVTPALDNSPQIIDNPNVAETVRSKSRVPTGTRKNVTPESLVPLEAPTQPRNYLTPSITSRKELPAVFARKRARSTAFGDEEDELAEDADGRPTATEAEAIAAKRRQNTLAARRSRKRKLEYQRQLEEVVEQERREKEMWKNRAVLLQAQLASLGVSAPFPDE